MRNTIVKSTVIFVILNFFVIIWDSQKVTHPLLGLNIYEFLKKENFYYENHTVLTNDGYLLTLQRIPFGYNQNTSCKYEKRSSVLLMHGMIGSAMDWVGLGPNNSLAFILAKKGFDVWLGNQRGSRWSRNHVTLNPDKDDKFWDFSWHDMGIYDLPAVIDYILNKTHNEKLTYIGISQGFTQLLVLGTQRPEYGKKILLACGLAPVTDMHKINSPLIRFLNSFGKHVFWLADKYNINKVFEYDSKFATVFRSIAFSNRVLFNLIAIKATQYIIGASDNINKEMMPFVAFQWPSGASIKQFKHYTQCSLSGVFAPYDYGETRNLEVYNLTKPPPYDVTKFSAPLAIYYSNMDKYVNNEVMLKTIAKIPNVVEKYKVPAKEFDHADFHCSNNINTLLHSSLIKKIEQYNNIKK